MQIRHLGVFAVIAFAGSGSIYFSNPATAQQRGPSNVEARYNIRLAGFKIGNLGFRSNFDGQRYDLKSDLRFSVLFGSYKWQSTTRAQGRSVRSGVDPASYAFDFRANKKRGQRRVAFAQGSAIKIHSQPPLPRGKKHVPVRSPHLKNVLDPMSAITKMTRWQDGNPCRQSFEVFDGKNRFRLTLSPRGRVRIRERARSNQPLAAFVCGVRYTPIAGHKKTSAVRQFARSKDIEIVLRPIPAARVFIPYQVKAPTTIGDVIISLSRVDITNARKQRIALRN